MNNTLKFIASCRLPTEWGDFTMHGFEEPSGQEHIALTMGDFSDDLPVLDPHPLRMFDRGCPVFQKMRLAARSLKRR